MKMIVPGVDHRTGEDDVKIVPTTHMIVMAIQYPHTAFCSYIAYRTEPL